MWARIPWQAMSCPDGESSDPTLYDGALWAITVDENTEYQRFRAVATMIVDHCANRLIVLDDATHDRCAALISTCHTSFPQL